LCPEQAVILEINPAKARAIARKFLAIYLTLPNYTNNFLRLGFNEADFANGGSDRLIDAVIAWGDARTVLSRIDEHRSAGADHVCIQVLTENKQEYPLRESPNCDGSSTRLGFAHKNLVRNSCYFKQAAIKSIDPTAAGFYLCQELARVLDRSSKTGRKTSCTETLSLSHSLNGDAILNQIIHNLLQQLAGSADRVAVFIDTMEG
jgi:hypothetical protein